MMTADIKKIQVEVYVYTKVDTCAEFQLSRLILIFISCQQLLSAIDSWWQLLQKNQMEFSSTPQHQSLEKC